ncbi:MAG: amidohydrolase family protein, partial [Bacillota bacterium]
MRKGEVDFSKMIIDADTHISPLEGDKRISAEILLEKMEKAGVDKSITWLQPPCNVAESNHYVYESVKNHPKRLLGFGWADPREGVDVARDNVKKCVYEYGFYGVKLNGAQNNYYIDDEELALPVIEEIAKTGKILAFHVGADAPERTNPKRVARIA